MNYPLRIPDQVKPHLRALRKSRGLTQAELGALVGVKQARIAEIEADPGVVSLEQLMKILAALGATLHLQAPENDAPAAPSPAAAAPTKKPAGARARGGITPIPAIPAKKGTW